MSQSDHGFCRCAAVVLALLVPATGALGEDNPFENLVIDSSLQPKVQEHYERPERFFAQGRLVEYVAQAEAFLARHPDSSRAGEVADDLLMAATVLRDDDIQRRARTRLLLDHPRSFAARHALASFPDENSCRTFLETLTDSLKDDMSVAHCRRLVEAVEVALEVWGPKLVSGDAFVLDCALISYGTHHAPLHELCRSQLAHCSEETREIAEIAFGTDGAKEKILRLHEIADNKSAQRYERFFLAELTTEKREQPDMLRLAAEHHLRGAEFARALPLIEQALGFSHDAQLLYWRGVCLAALDRKEEAREALRAVQRDFAATPWSDPAGRLEQMLAGAETSLDGHAKELFTLLERMRGRGLEQFEIFSEFRQSNDALIRTYLSVDFPNSGLELLLKRDEKLLLAYRLKEQKARIYFDGEPSILEFEQPGFPLPVPNARLEGPAKGGYRFEFGGRAESASGDGGLSEARDSMLNSPVLSSPHAIAECLRYTLAKIHACAEPVRYTETEAVLSWKTPEIGSPTFRELEVRIARKEPRVSLIAASERGTGRQRSGKLELRHGPAGSFEFKSPEWPDLPATRREKMDPSTFFRLFGTAIQAFMGDAAP